MEEIHTNNTEFNGFAAMNEKRISSAMQTLRDYKDARTNFEKRIVDEEQWWKLRHWDIVKNSSLKSDCEPVSAWLFNSIANKHADAMDNYPEPNVLPRERGDEADAKILSSVLPVIIERCNFEQIYSDAWWYKLKHGAVAYGVFWNNELSDGIGDIDIEYIDLLNIFWEPGISDIQDSRNLYIVSLVDNDILETEYPNLKGKLGGADIDVKQYVYDDQVDVSNKSVVIDWYYKETNEFGKKILHFCKFVNNHILFSTENEEAYRESGLYEHGKYPVVLDVMYPEEGTPCGFGLISIMKSPQTYIDKLNQVILENAVMSTRKRYFAKEGCGINEEEFLDWSKPIVHVEGSIDEERLREITVTPVPGNVINILQMKIDELKETSSNRDVSQGSTNSGVTAAAAIAALQEAGNKISRDTIHASYRAYTQINYLIIELIRQFYDITRSFRITGVSGENEYIDYNNSSLNADGTRKPVFDISVKPQKRSAYSKLSQNELAKEMYNMGFFNPQLASQALVAVDMMEFDGKDKIKAKIQEGETLYNQIQSLQSEVQQLSQTLAYITGQKKPTAGTEEITPVQRTPTVDEDNSGLSYAEKAVANARTSMSPESLEEATKGAGI